MYKEGGGDISFPLFSFKFTLSGRFQSVYKE